MRLARLRSLRLTSTERRRLRGSDVERSAEEAGEVCGSVLKSEKAVGRFTE